MAANNFFLSEEAISGKDLSEDFFNFNVYANKIKDLIQKNSNNSNPLVIGIYGKWGEGKSSFTNLIRDKIEHFEGKGKNEYLVYDFNPWLYDSQKELVNDFFEGLKNSFYVKDQETIGDRIVSYSKYFKALKISSTTGIPGVFSNKVEFSLDKIFKKVGEHLGTSPNTIQFLRDQINKAIADANFKVVVFIDDIDRLDKNEIFSVLKLVKLNASFDNFIFILNLDKDHVGKAIAKKYGIKPKDGNLFLEKIINIPINLPKVEDSLLHKFFSTKLLRVFENFTFLQSEESESYFRAINIFFSAMNFSNPREIIRILNNFYIGALTLENEVDIEELFWIEWLKIKHPDFYQNLKEISPANLVLKDIDLLFKDSSYFVSFQEKLDHLFKDQKNLPIKFSSFFSTSNLIVHRPQIRFPEYFDRYFTYHIGSDTPMELLKVIVNFNEKTKDAIEKEVTRLSKLEFGYYKIVKLIDLLKNKKPQNEIIYGFLFSIIDLFPSGRNNQYGFDIKVSLIEEIARNLASDDLNSEKHYIINMVDTLNIFELCHFTRKFKDDTISPKKELIELIAKKANQEFSILKPIYAKPVAAVKMVMDYWKQSDEDKYNQHIKNSLVDLKRVKQLVRNFPGFWNYSYYGALTQSNFDYMKELVDVSFVFSKITEYGNDLVEEVKKNKSKFLSMDEVAEYTEIENLEQFIYWYLLDNNIEKNH